MLGDATMPAPVSAATVSYPTVPPVLPFRRPAGADPEAASCHAAALGLSRPAFAQAAPSSPAATKLTDKVTLITGAGNNIVVLAGDNGSLLVDCGEATHALDVLRWAGNVKTVINTHWHLESTGANEAMAKAGAKLVSHVNTKLWMTQEIIHDWEEKVFPPRAK